MRSDPEHDDALLRADIEATTRLVYANRMVQEADRVLEGTRELKRRLAIQGEDPVGRTEVSTHTFMRMPCSLSISLSLSPSFYFSLVMIYIDRSTERVRGSTTICRRYIIAHAN